MPTILRVTALCPGLYRTSHFTSLNGRAHKDCSSAFCHFHNHNNKSTAQTRKQDNPASPVDMSDQTPTTASGMTPVQEGLLNADLALRKLFQMLITSCDAEVQSVLDGFRREDASFVKAVSYLHARVMKALGLTAESLRTHPVQRCSCLKTSTMRS